MRVRYLLLSILGPDGIRARQPIGRITSLNRNKLVTDEVDTAFYRHPGWSTTPMTVAAQADRAYHRVPSWWAGARPHELAVSHLPETSLARVDGHGMNEEEPGRPAFAGGSGARPQPGAPRRLRRRSIRRRAGCCGMQYLQEAEQVFAECSRVRRPPWNQTRKACGPAASSPGARRPGASSGSSSPGQGQ